MSVAFDCLATADDEVDLMVGLLKHAIGVAPFGRWRWSSFLPIIVLAIMVVLTTSIVASIVALVIVAFITTIHFVVVMSVIVVITTVVVTPVIAAVVAAIITSISVIIARIGFAITVISSIRSTVMIVESLV
jgi:hypothetical protein